MNEPPYVSPYVADDAIGRAAPNILLLSALAVFGSYAMPSMGGGLQRHDLLGAPYDPTIAARFAAERKAKKAAAFIKRNTP